MHRGGGHRLNGFRVFVFALIALGLAVSILPAQAKTFRWAFDDDPASMDPHAAGDTLTLGFLGNVYEGLVRRGKRLEIEPALATEWSNPAPDVWRFKLRPGVKFHDGSPFTADDVIFSWRRARHEGSGVKPIIAGIKDVRKIDDLTVDVITHGPRPILTSEISRWYIMSKSWSEKHDAAAPAGAQSGREGYAARHANGTGPFRLESRSPDVKTVLDSNPGWWDRRTDNVTEAIFTPIKSAAVRAASLLLGELEMMSPVSLQDIDRVKRAGGLRLVQGPEARTVFLGMDVWRDELLYSNVKGSNPLKDARVRKALYQVIDIEVIRKKVMRGASWPAGLLIGPAINGFDEGLNERFPYDPATSKMLLAEAGYPDGFSIVLDCPNGHYVNDKAVCRAVAAMLARINVEVTLNTQSKARHFAKLMKQDTSFFLLGWMPATLDAHNVFYNTVMTREDKLAGKAAHPGQGLWNAGGYANPEVDALIGLAAREFDANKRRELIGKALSIHKEEVGHIPLHQQVLSWGVKRNVELHQPADDTLSLRWVRIN